MNILDKTLRIQLKRGAKVGYILKTPVVGERLEYYFLEEKNDTLSVASLRRPYCFVTSVTEIEPTILKVETTENVVFYLEKLKKYK